MANATIRTYTATPCGPAPLPAYEVAKTQGDEVPDTNLAAVKIADNPAQWTCCTINKKTINETPEEDVYECQNSGFAVANCGPCNEHW